VGVRLASVTDRENALLAREESVSSREEGESLKLLELEEREKKLAKAIKEPEQVKLEELAMNY
jgi:hypothetical protein